MEVDFANVRQVEGILDALAPLKKRIEDMVNLANPPECAKRCLLSNNKIMRLCLLAGLAQSDKRSTGDLDGVSVSKNSSRIFDSFFTVASMGEVFSTILKMRYEGSGGGSLRQAHAVSCNRGRDAARKGGAGTNRHA